MKRLALLLFAAGCASPAACPSAELAPLDREPAFAFVASDYASSAIGLLAEDGSLLSEAWIDTGTVAPGLVPALSGDVVLASAPPAPCVVTVIDRSGTDVITFLDACANTPLIAQLDVGPSFDANPQDVLAIDETRALVSRLDPNLAPGASELERGSDLLVIDWRGARVLSRVDLSTLDVVDGERLYARPGRMALVASDDARAVVVGLARLSEDFMRAGPGAVAIVDPATLRASELALDGLVNCAEVDAVPGEPSLAIVTCQGATFADEEGRRAGAGLAALELDGEVRVRAIWRAADHAGAVFNTWSVPLAGDRVVTVAMGDVGTHVPDRAGLIELDGSDPPLLAEAREPFVLGDGTFDRRAGILLLPDAHDGTIRRFAMDGSPHELEPIAAAPCRGLPPREIRTIRD